jgi:hypothetical protein
MLTRKNLSELFDVHPQTINMWLKRPEFKDIFKKNEIIKTKAVKNYYFYDEKIVDELINKIEELK